MQSALERPSSWTDPATSKRMARIRQRDTRPELVVRARLRQLGIHYRCNYSGLPGSPDIANKSKRWAVFVHGCFWHGHIGCSKATVPKRNRSFWLEKIRTNRRRDRRNENALRKVGFAVLVIWECETFKWARKPENDVPKAVSYFFRR
jgi:DNA mismatch endonuclease, patch repair protein